MFFENVWQTLTKYSGMFLTGVQNTLIIAFFSVFFGVILGTLMGARPGVGTIVTALCMGPLIDFFNRKVARPFLERAGR